MNINKMAELVKDGGNEAINEFLIKQSYKDSKREGLIKGLIIGGCLGAIIMIRYIQDADFKRSLDEDID